MSAPGPVTAPRRGSTIGGALRDRIAALLVVRIGSNMRPFPTVEDDAPRLLELLDRLPIGGLLLFNGRADRSPAVLERLQRQSRRPLLACSDIERGAGQQLAGLTLFPHALAIDALGSEAAEAAFAFGRCTAREARAHGLHAALGPVADIHANPRNPIIGARAFGREPQRVAELVRAYIRGCRSGGLLTTAKHFPGHGDTHEDSHDALPTVDAGRAALAANELVPFAAAIAEGVDMVMSAHVRYPHLDPQPAPATCSQAILTELLRGQLGFAGATITDSLLMGGVRQAYAHEGELALAALQAGCDALLDPADPVGTTDFLVGCVEQGRLAEARVDEAARRIDRVKAAIIDPPPDDAAEPAAAATAARIAREAVRLVDGDPRQLPFDPRRPLAVVLFRPHATHRDPPEQPLAAALRARFAAVDYHEVGGDAGAPDWSALESALAATEQRLVAVIVKPAAWQRFGLPPDWEAWIRGQTLRRPTVVACLGASEGLAPYPAAAARVGTFSDVPASQEALADRLAFSA